MKHTPGPWRVADNGRIFAENGTLLGSTDYKNARLIAAAPKMYEAIKALIAPATISEHMEVMNYANSLLAQIDGKEG